MADLIDRDVIIEELKKLRFPCMLPAGADYLEGIQTAVRAITAIINSAESVSRWIPCSERLPEKDTAVLICGCRHVVTAYYDAVKGVFRLTEDDNLYYLQEKVTHWMPLPERPEIEVQEDDER